MFGHGIKMDRDLEERRSSKTAQLRLRSGKIGVIMGSQTLHWEVWTTDEVGTVYAAGRMRSAAHPQWTRDQL